MASKSKKLGVVADIFEKNLEGTVRKVPIIEISPSDDQPRENRDINIGSLAQSLKEEGLLQPIIITKENSHYKIIAGERRFRAASSLGWTEIECRILKKDQKEKFKLAIIENIQRENFDSFEEARAYRRLKDEYSYTDQELSSIIGKSRNYISEILSITMIPKDIEKRARKAGIHSKNLLSQLYQAVKIGKEDKFLESFSSGNLKTVKKAKEFVKKQKSPQGDFQQRTTKIIVNLSWSSNTKLSGDIGIDLEKEDEIIIQDLENHLKSSVLSFLKKHLI